MVSPSSANKVFNLVSVAHAAGEREAVVGAGVVVVGVVEADTGVLPPLS